jgi:hypothetical protein
MLNLLPHFKGVDTLIDTLTNLGLNYFLLNYFLS